MRTLERVVAQAASGPQQLPTIFPMLAEAGINASMAARFTKRFHKCVSVDPQSGCWLWGGYLVNGYGRTRIGTRAAGHTWPVHRLVYTYLVGPVAENLQMDHLCRVRNCCNPDHLEPVEQAENMRRGDLQKVYDRARSMTHCGKGHEFTDENTYTWNNMRRCKTCRSVTDRQYKERRRARRENSGQSD